MRALALLIEYDGTDYAGWQIQPNGVTIQELLEGAVQSAFGVRVPVIGSGRTDAGVHAYGQVAHLHLPDDAHAIPTGSVAAALNSRLPADVRVRAVRKVDETFHARFLPVWREYRYRICTQPTVFRRRFEWTPPFEFDVATLNDCASVFVGAHNFTSFSKLNPDTKNYVCDVLKCEVQHTDSSSIEIIIRADRFVYGMCRSIVGAMVEVARGRYTLDELQRQLNTPSRDKHMALAPACGLTLYEVRYPTSIW